MDGNRVYILGVEGMLHCLRLADGAVLWKCDTARQFGVVQNFFGVGSTPIVEGDLLIAVIGGSPAEDQRLPPGQLDRVSGNGTGLVAFDKYTGAVRYTATDELAGYAAPTVATIGGRRWCFALCRGGLVGFEPQAGHVDFHYPWRATLLESVNASHQWSWGTRSSFPRRTARAAPCSRQNRVATRSCGTTTQTPSEVAEDALEYAHLP